MTGLPVWVVAYEYGSSDQGGGGGFDWFPYEYFDNAVAVCGALYVGFNDPTLAVYFIEYYPETPYSIDADVRDTITDEIDAEIWDVLPDGRPEGWAL